MKSAISSTKDNLATTAHILNSFLADEFLLYTKTRDAHWNVEGPDFLSAHKFFESQYEQLEEIIDDVAERIRSLGHYAPATLKSYLELTHLTEQSREDNDSAGFIKELLRDHESIITRLKENINNVADDLQHAGTGDFMTGLLKMHEKMAWMLKAHLK
jgi:starvation-inducible DNA-binding protein